MEPNPEIASSTSLRHERRSELNGSEIVPNGPIESDGVWLTEPQLRDRLQYSKATITRLREGGLPCVGSGRLRRYHRPTVLRWLSKRA
jgi:hypothetical protein